MYLKMQATEGCNRRTGAQETEDTDKCQLCLNSHVLDFVLVEVIVLGKSAIFLEPQFPHRWKRENIIILASVTGLL